MTFPFYKQLDQMDCGPTCLRMIAKHYGRNYTLQTLRDKTSICKDGVSLLGISEAAEAIGFRTRGVKIPFEKFANEAPLPCIVHWRQNHFFVVYEIKGKTNWMSRITGGFKLPNEPRPFSFNTFDQYFSDENIVATDNSGSIVKDRNHPNDLKKTIFAADPAAGLVSLSPEEFCQGWISTKDKQEGQGVALLLEPTPDFYEYDDEKVSKYTFKRVFQYFWQYKKLLLQLAIGLVVGLALQMLLPFLTQSIVDIGINTNNISFIYLVLIAQLALITSRLAVEFIRSWILLYISTRVNLSILSDFLIKLMKLPIKFFDVKHLGDIIQRVGDHHRIEAFLTNQTLTVLFSVFSLVFLSIVLAIFNALIFVIFVTSSLLYVGWVILFLKQRRKLDYIRFGLSAENQSSLVQLIQGMQEIKLAGAERPVRWIWEQIQVRLFKIQMKGLALSQYQQAGAFAINEGKNILIIFFAAYAVINGQMTLGAMLAIQQIIGQLNSPVEQLIGFVTNLQDAKISLERLNEIHEVPNEEPAEQIKQQGGLKNLDINFKTVSFRYPGAGNELVLNNIDLKISSGATTAIVGMSGSGKTTLLKLLLKFYEPTNGEIKLSGISSRHLSHSFWRSHCGVVMQDGFIFSNTIARNIAVGVDKIDAERLYRAAHVANLQDFINSLPLGYHTKVGSGGNGLSQGQRQRILIARCVYKDPQYIFFDEATNALDANNEAVIMNNLNNFFQGKTVVVVAHRLSTVKNADQIIVLHEGSVVETGSHTELIKQKGNYWELVKNQLELGA